VIQALHCACQRYVSPALQGGGRLDKNVDNTGESIREDAVEQKDD
jgi:hypothetical protein